MFVKADKSSQQVAARRQGLETRLPERISWVPTTETIKFSLSIQQIYRKSRASYELN
jgi:hypothetical protein